MTFRPLARFRRRTLTRDEVFDRLVEGRPRLGELREPPPAGEAASGRPGAHSLGVIRSVGHTTPGAGGQDSTDSR